MAARVIRQARQERQRMKEQEQRRRPTQAELNRARGLGVDPRHFDDIV
jgi:hypothetical protein